jgi:hypothetical protein
VNFDNLGYSFLTLFAVCTMEGWANVLYYAQAVTGESAFFVFLAIIVVGNFTIVNLMIAAILVQIDTIEDERKLARVFGLPERNPDPPDTPDSQNSNDKSFKEEEPLMEVPVKVSYPSLLHRLHDEFFRIVDMPLCKMFCYDGVPRTMTKYNWARRARWIAIHDASPFSYFIQGCILCNLVVLAMDAHNIPKSTQHFLQRANLTLTGIFTFEMIIKLVIGGIPDYVHSTWNLFDGFIVIGSVVELVVASGSSSLSALRAVRMLRLTRVARLARLANKWKSLQDVLKLIKKSSSGVGPVLLLLILFMFIFSILGMQMFGESVTSDEYVRFDSFTLAFVQCFYVITGEAWVDIMYVSMADSGVFAFIYFVALIIIGCFILVNLVLAVILGDTMVPNSVGFEAGLHQLDATLESYAVRCSLSRWKWSIAQMILAETRAKTLNEWKASIEQHGVERLSSIARGLGMSNHFLDGIHSHLQKLAHSSQTALAEHKSDEEGKSDSPPSTPRSRAYNRLDTTDSTTSATSVTSPRDDFDDKTWNKLRAATKVIGTFATSQVPESWTEEIDKENKTLKYRDSVTGATLSYEAHPEHADFKAELNAILHGKSADFFKSKVHSFMAMDSALNAFGDLETREANRLTRSERKKHMKSKLGLAKIVITSVDAFEGLEEKATGWDLKFIRFRKFSIQVVSSTKWHDLIMMAIVVSSLMMVLQDENTSFIGIFFILDILCGVIFAIEVVLMCGALESVRDHDKNIVGFRAYIEDPWNQLDLAIVISTFLAPIFTVTDLSLGYWCCTIIRAFRPLKVINRVASLKSTVHLLYVSLIRLGTLGMFITFAFVAYAVVGMQLLKGLYYYCDDGDYADDDEYLNTVGQFPHNSPKDGKINNAGLYETRPCKGVFTNLNGTTLEAFGEWRNPTFHFDDFFNSFLTVFVLSTEGWAEIVWIGLSATRVGYSGKPYHNTNILILWYFFFGVAFFALYMINLFIGVVFDLYIEMKTLEDDGTLKKRDERSWSEYVARLELVKCIKRIPPPQHLIRQKIEKMVRSDLFQKFIISVIFLNALALAVIHRGQGPHFSATLEWINVALAMIFVLEAILKILGHGVKTYFSDSVDLFDFTVSVVSSIDSLLFMTQTCADNDSAFLKFVRSMRVFRLLRLVNLFRGCEDILLACKFALPRLLMVCSLLLILIFFFANIGWVIFHDFQDHGSTYAHFRTVFGGMQLLFVIMTGDAWTDTMGELVDEKPEWKVIIVIYFISYLIVQYFVVVNLFVMVVCEAFEILSEGNRTAVERVLPVFQKVWSTFDPEATRYINEASLETLLRQIPEPIGVSFQASYTQLRTKADYLRLDMVDSNVEFSDVLTGLVAIWLTEEGQTVDTEIAHQMNQLSASIILTAASRRWLQRRQVRLAKLALMENMELEKMRREDARLTNLLKRVTTVAGKVGLKRVGVKTQLEPLSNAPISKLLDQTTLMPLGGRLSDSLESVKGEQNDEVNEPLQDELIKWKNKPPKGSWMMTNTRIAPDPNSESTTSSSSLAVFLDPTSKGESI